MHVRARTSRVARRGLRQVLCIGDGDAHHPLTDLCQEPCPSERGWSGTWTKALTECPRVSSRMATSTVSIVATASNKDHYVVEGEPVDGLPGAATLDPLQHRHIATIMDDTDPRPHG